MSSQVPVKGVEQFHQKRPVRLCEKQALSMKTNRIITAVALCLGVALAAILLEQRRSPVAKKETPPNIATDIQFLQFDDGNMKLYQRGWVATADRILSQRSKD